MDNANDKATRSIAVIVKVFGGLREEFGTAEQRIVLPPGSPLGVLLAQLRRNKPALGCRLDEGLAKGYLNILVNGRNARFLEQMDTRLHDADVVAFLPPIGGG
ncbi:MoaD/ThiS family protein [Candidatus Bipolaricaulota bacterium]